MHIILGTLGTLVTILILLNRLADLGIDIGGLNPYLWNRRRKWRKMYEGNPVFKIENPMDATAILMVAVTKADGDMTKEDKALILKLYEEKFNLTKKDAAGLLISSVHLLGDGLELRANVEKFLAPSKAVFTEMQAESAISLISQTAGHLGTMSPYAEELLANVKNELTPSQKHGQTW